jgi:quercetin dioxygenase-like cupin family protein
MSKSGSPGPVNIENGNSRFDAANRSFRMLDRLILALVHRLTLTVPARVCERMSETDHEDAEASAEPTPLVRRADGVGYETVAAADGMRKGVLVGEDDGAPNLAIRRFVLDPGARVPKHTNAMEHEQYVLEGEYVVGLDDEEHVVTAGDSLFIPAGVVHWYRNESDEPGAFICAVPTGDDEIRVVEEE